MTEVRSAPTKIPQHPSKVMCVGLYSPFKKIHTHIHNAHIDILIYIQIYIYIYIYICKVLSLGGERRGETFLSCLPTMTTFIIYIYKIYIYIILAG